MAPASPEAGSWTSASPARVASWTPVTVRLPVPAGSTLTDVDTAGGQQWAAGVAPPAGNVRQPVLLRRAGSGAWSPVSVPADQPWLGDVHVLATAEGGLWLSAMGPGPMARHFDGRSWTPWRGVGASPATDTGSAQSHSWLVGARDARGAATGPVWLGVQSDGGPSTDVQLYRVQAEGLTRLPVPPAGAPMTLLGAAADDSGLWVLLTSDTASPQQPSDGTGSTLPMQVWRWDGRQWAARGRLPSLKVPALAVDSAGRAAVSGASFVDPATASWRVRLLRRTDDGSWASLTLPVGARPGPIAPGGDGTFWLPAADNSPGLPDRVGYWQITGQHARRLEGQPVAGVVGLSVTDLAVDTDGSVAVVGTQDLTSGIDAAPFAHVVRPRPPSGATAAGTASGPPVLPAGLRRWVRAAPVPGVHPMASLVTVDSAGPDATWAGGQEYLQPAGQYPQPGGPSKVDTGRPLLLHRGADRRWRRVDLPVDSPVQIESVLATGPQEVWLAGRDGQGRVWTGRWSDGQWWQPSPSAALWAGSADRIRLIGVPGQAPWLRHPSDMGTYLLDRFDGRGWQQVPTPGGYHFTAAVRMADDGRVRAALAAGDRDGQEVAGLPQVAVVDWVPSSESGGRWTAPTPVPPGQPSLKNPRDLLVGPGDDVTVVGAGPDDPLPPVSGLALSKPYGYRPAPTAPVVVAARHSGNWQVGSLPDRPSLSDSLQLVGDAENRLWLVQGVRTTSYSAKSNSPHQQLDSWRFDGRGWARVPDAADPGLPGDSGRWNLALARIPGSRTTLAVGTVEVSGTNQNRIEPWIAEIDGLLG